MTTSRYHSILCKMSSTGHLSLSHTPFCSRSCHQTLGIAGSENMYWTQWKNRQLPLGDHNWNISLRPSTCDCLPSLSILHKSHPQSPDIAISMSPNSVSDHAPPLYPRTLGALVLQQALNVWDRQDITEISSFTAAVQTILVPSCLLASTSTVTFPKLQSQSVTFHPFHWNFPRTTANPAGSPRCFSRPLLGCSNLEEFWTGHFLKM